MKKKIGQYIMEQLIGSGPSGEVYKGSSMDEKGKKFVIKMIPKNSLSETDLEHMKTEEGKVECLDHPNVVKLVDICVTENHYYVVTEYSNGGDLSAFRKKKGGVVDETTVKFLLRQIVKGLNDIRAKNAICKEIKLSDILLSYPNEEAKLKDKPIVKLDGFKFVRLTEQGENNTAKIAPMAYVSTNTAPELFYTQQPSFKSDIWSLGTIVYELLCGQSCFSGINRKQLRLDIEKGTYEIPKQFNLSAECLNFLNACLQVDQKNRIEWSDLMKNEFICTENKTKFIPGLFRKLNKIHKADFEVNDNYIFSNKIRHIFPISFDFVKEELKGGNSESEEEYIEVDLPLDTPKKIRTIERIESSGFIVLTSISNIET